MWKVQSMMIDGPHPPRIYLQLIYTGDPQDLSAGVTFTPEDLEKAVAPVLPGKRDPIFYSAPASSIVGQQSDDDRLYDLTRKQNRTTWENEELARLRAEWKAKKGYDYV